MYDGNISAACLSVPSRPTRPPDYSGRAPPRAHMHFELGVEVGAVLLGLAALLTALVWLSQRSQTATPPKTAANPPPTARDDEDGAPCRLLFVDADNVRAALAWPPREAFRHSVSRWSSTQPDLTAVILATDGGGDMAATFLGARMVLTTSGRWRADDTIVRDVRWLFANGQDELTVVTSDKLLRKRCRAARGNARQRVRFEASEAFASWLPAWQDAAASAEPVAPTCLHRRLRTFVEWAASQPQPSTAAKERLALDGPRPCSAVRGRKR